MVLEPLTPEERARHARGIERIRRRLFRRYQPADYFIVPNSEHVLPGYAEGCWNAACGSYRVFHVGGLSYAVDCKDAEGLSRFTVLHIETDQFSFWLAAARGHTVVSAIARFRELDEIVYAQVCSLRRSNVKPAYIGEADHLIDF